MTWESTAVTDRGRARANNEDAYAIRADRGVFVLADGMGGHAAGEVASTLAAECVCESIANGLETRTGNDRLLEEAMREAVLAAHHAILERARAEPDKQGMGTTLTALVLGEEPAGYRIAHVGDSRAYRFHRGELHQLTTDHTWVQDQVEHGLLSPDAARGHPRANILTRAVGTFDEPPDIDILSGVASAGDLFLLCSDGLSNVLEPAEIQDALAGDAALESIARGLVEKANNRGGPDNITAILVRIAA